MNKFGKGTERREFGRRETCLKAIIIVPGRPRIPCVVRDISVGGALLEVDVPAWLPFTFDLVIEATKFTTGCEIRHQRPTAVGVRFIAATAAKVAPRTGMRVESDAWTGAR